MHIQKKHIVEKSTQQKKKKIIITALRSCKICLFIPLDSKKSIGSKPFSFYFKSCYKSHKGWVLRDVLSQKLGVNHLRISPTMPFNRKWKSGPHYYQWLLIGYYQLLNCSEYSNAACSKKQVRSSGFKLLRRITLLSSFPSSLQICLITYSHCPAILLIQKPLHPFGMWLGAGLGEHICR